jgi:hypothetical protein
MTKSTYTGEEVIIERELNKLYGMAIARARNKAVLEEVKSSYGTIIRFLYAQWRESQK